MRHYLFRPSAPAAGRAAGPPARHIGHLYALVVGAVVAAGAAASLPIMGSPTARPLPPASLLALTVPVHLTNAVAMHGRRCSVGPCGCDC